MWRCQHSSDLTNCDTGQFLDQIELFFVGMPNRATPGMKPGDTRDGTVRHPGMEPVDPGMEPVDTRNGTGRHPEWNRSTPGMEPASQFSFFFWPARKLSVKTVKSVKRPGSEKERQKRQFCSLCGGCSSSMFCVSYRPCFERCPRIWYFAGLQILGLRGARTYNLWSSEVLANRPCAGFGATREACERLERPANQLGSDLWACEQPGRPAS